MSTHRDDDEQDDDLPAPAPAGPPIPADLDALAERIAGPGSKALTIAGIDHGWGVVSFADEHDDECYPTFTVWGRDAADACDVLEEAGVERFELTVEPRPQRGPGCDDDNDNPHGETIQ